MTTVSAEDFLRALFPEGTKGKIELRAISPTGGAVPRSFSDITNSAHRAAFLAQHPRDNIFVGVATRADASSGDLRNCLTVGCLWSDIDFKATSEATLRALLAVFPIAPSLAVRSGYGVHLYWLLLTRLAVTDPRLRRALLGLAAVLQGDPAVAEPARIMRLPETTNFKYDPPRPVTVTKFEPGHRMDIDELLKHLPTIDPGPSTGRAAGVVPPITLTPLEPVLATCDFMHWCRDHPAKVSEPLWYALLSNLSRCAGGREAAHAFSKDYPGYTARETDAKFDHARDGSEPITCARIQALGFPGCPREGHGVAAPAALGLRPRDVSAQAAAVVAALGPGASPDGNGAPTTDSAPPSSGWTRWDAAKDWKFPAPAYLIDRVLPRRGVVWACGLAHSGKSLLMQYISLSLACRRAQLAEHFPIHDHPIVVYVSQEDPGGRTEQRRNEIVAAWGVRPDVGRLTFLIKDGIDLLNAEHVARLRDLCLELGATVLVLDTWTALSPTADPLAAKEQAQLAQIVVALADAIGGLVIVVDHTRKNMPDGGPQTLADLFGPSQKMQRAEHAILLRAVEGADRRVEILIDSKDADELSRFFLTRSAQGSNLEKFVWAGTVQAAAEKSRETGQKNREAVLQAVPIGQKVRATLPAVMVALKKGDVVLAEGTVRGHLTALVNENRVRRAGKARATVYWRRLSLPAPPSGSRSHDHQADRPPPRRSQHQASEASWLAQEAAARAQRTGSPGQCSPCSPAIDVAASAGCG